jgi:hypothetical protein
MFIAWMVFNFVYVFVAKKKLSGIKSAETTQPIAADP